MKVYSQKFRIRWSHVDAAGIVYHPQYFVILNGLMEDFFRDVVGVSYRESIASGMGYPIVQASAEFPRPSKVDDEVTLHLWIEHLGQTSMGFGMSIVGEDGVRVLAKETCVYVQRVDGDRMQKHALPDAVRTICEAYLATEAEVEAFHRQ